MSDNDKLRKILREELLANSAVEPEAHKEHHDFLKEWIAKEKRKQERYEKVRTQVTGWGIISVLTGIGAAVYNTFFKSNGG